MNKPLSIITDNKRLILNWKQKLKHYSPAIWIFAVILIMIIYVLWDEYFSAEKHGVRTMGEMLQAYLYLGIMPTIIVFVKYRKLRFKEIPISVTEEELEEAIKRTAKDRKWHLKLNQENVYQYESAPGFTTNWGMMITIILEKESFLFNNICSLETRSSISLGLVHKDRDVFLTHLKQVILGEDYTKMREINDTQWNWKMVLARLFLYPLCIFFLWVSIFHLIPSGKYILPIITISIALTYLISDLYMIFKRKEKVPDEK
ncbi:MAG: hypothetical protein GQ574_07165 [Crocinitomix sp.]|nr:hypothetical protein [Crocinitomix sp.]